jgi:hypothetical protein
MLDITHDDFVSESDIYRLTHPLSPENREGQPLIKRAIAANYSKLFLLPNNRNSYFFPLWGEYPKGERGRGDG